MFCHNCGSTLKDGTNFCSNCGAKHLKQDENVSESPKYYFQQPDKEPQNLESPIKEFKQNSQNSSHNQVSESNTALTKKYGNIMSILRFVQAGINFLIVIFGMCGWVILKSKINNHSYKYFEAEAGTAFVYGMLLGMLAFCFLLVCFYIVLGYKIRKNQWNFFNQIVSILEIIIGGLMIVSIVMIPVIGFGIANLVLQLKRNKINDANL